MSKSSIIYEELKLHFMRFCLQPIVKNHWTQRSATQILKRFADLSVYGLTIYHKLNILRLSPFRLVQNLDFGTNMMSI